MSAQSPPSDMFYGLAFSSPRVPFLFHRALGDSQTLFFIDNDGLDPSERRRSALCDLVADLIADALEHIGPSGFRCTYDGYRFMSKKSFLSHFVKDHKELVFEVAKALLGDSEVDFLSNFFTKLCYPDICAVPQPAETDRVYYASTLAPAMPNIQPVVEGANELKALLPLVAHSEYRNALSERDLNQIDLSLCSLFPEFTYSTQRLDEIREQLKTYGPIETRAERHARHEKRRKERKERERKEAERERLEKERLEKERLEKERLEKERVEREQLERERLKREQEEAAKKEQARKEKERIEKERIEKERAEAEKAERERAERERAEAERKAREEYERRLLSAYTHDEEFESGLLNQIISEVVDPFVRNITTQLAPEVRREKERERRRAEQEQRQKERERRDQERRRIAEARRELADEFTNVILAEVVCELCEDIVEKVMSEIETERFQKIVRNAPKFEPKNKANTKPDGVLPIPQSQQIVSPAIQSPISLSLSGQPSQAQSQSQGPSLSVSGGLSRHSPSLTPPVVTATDIFIAPKERITPQGNIPSSALPSFASDVFMNQSVQLPAGLPPIDMKSYMEFLLFQQQQQQQQQRMQSAHTHAQSQLGMRTQINPLSSPLSDNTLTSPFSYDPKVSLPVTGSSSLFPTSPSTNFSLPNDPFASASFLQFNPSMNTSETASPTAANFGSGISTPPGLLPSPPSPSLPNARPALDLPAPSVLQHDFLGLGPSLGSPNLLNTPNTSNALNNNINQSASLLAPSFATEQFNVPHFSDQRPSPLQGAYPIDSKPLTIQTPSFAQGNSLFTPFGSANTKPLHGYGTYSTMF